MKINGMAKVDKTPVDEIVKSKELGHVSFDASFYPENYKDLLFALKPSKSKEQIKEQFISEIAKLENIAPGVLETVEKIDPENLVSLNYFEIFDLSLKNVYKTVNTTHKVYDTVGVEVKTTVSSSGEISSTATPMKEYSHSYTTSKDEILYKKYNGDFSSIESHSFLKKGIMYSLPSKVDVKDLLLFDDIKEFDIIRIDQEGYRSVNVGSSYSLERIKSTHEMYIKNVVNHKLTSATYIENITLNKIVLHPIWKVEFDFTVNGRKERFTSFISDCDKSFTSSEYLGLPLVKKEISGAHSTAAVAYTATMAIILTFGLLILIYAFASFNASTTIPYMCSYLALLILTIFVGVVGCRAELQNVLFYTYFKEKLPKMYVAMLLGVIMLVVTVLLGIRIF